MNKNIIIGASTISLILTTAAYSVDLEDTLINKTLNKTNSFISGLTNGLTESLLNTDRVKHLELDIQVQESSKPTFSLSELVSPYTVFSQSFILVNPLNLLANLITFYLF